MNLSTSEKNRLASKYGPWALITGASSGIGKELAERLAEAGLNLMLVARREQILNEVASHLTETYGVETQTLAADLSKDIGILQTKAVTEHLDIGLFIASAGYGTSGSFLESDLTQELNMLEVNCAALLSLTHHFGQKFARNKKGGIILLASLVGFQGVPYAAHYAATKAYVQSLAEALHVELKPNGIDVLAAAPGPVASGFANRANMQMDITLKPSDVGVPILRALGRKSTVLPGFLTKFLVGSLSMLPRWGKVRVMKLVMGGMTNHQRTASMV